MLLFILHSFDPRISQKERVCRRYVCRINIVPFNPDWVARVHLTSAELGADIRHCSDHLLQHSGESVSRGTDLREWIKCHHLRYELSYPLSWLKSTLLVLKQAPLLIMLGCQHQGWHCAGAGVAGPRLLHARLHPLCPGQPTLVHWSYLLKKYFFHHLLRLRISEAPVPEDLV